MYFNNNKNNTNIDSEFSSKNNIINFIIKFKIFIIIIPILIIIVLILSFSNKKGIHREINTYLTLTGDEIISIYQGTDYIEPGYSAYNDNKLDLTNEVNISSNLDTNTIGEYEISYTINNITKKRKINVIKKSEEYTFIYLNTINNSVDIYLNINEKYNEPGYTVFNSAGKNLTNSVKISGNVNTSKKGIYKLTYSLIDSNNVTISTSRNVIVMDSNINLLLANNNYTNKDVKINIKITDDYFDYMILPNNQKINNKDYTYTVNENGKYTFITYNKQGTKKESSIEVKNIDKTLPTGSCNGSYSNGKSTINVDAKDNIGINKYVINNTSYTSNKITINKEISTANITIYDKAGNIKNISCNLENKNEEKEETTVNPPAQTQQPENKEKSLEIHFIASGHYDDAILIRTTDKTILIDSGRWNCKNYVTPYLNKIGVKKIDAMLGSHLHYNHIQAQADILDNFEVNKIYYPDDIFTCKSKGSCDSEDQKYILTKIKEKNITPTVVKAGTKINIEDIELYFIGPESITTGTYAQNSNSSIMILKYYNNTFMFTGDAGSATLNTTNLKNMLIN